MPHQDDDPFLAAALQSAQDDPFLIEAERQHRGVGATLKRSARETLRQTIGAITAPFRIGKAIGEHPGDVTRQAARGLAESGLATARGVERFLGPRAPGYYDERGVFHEGGPLPDDVVRSTPVQRLTEEIRETYGEPESTPGVVAGVAGRVAGDVAQYATGTRLLGAAGALPKATGIGSRIARGAIAAAPIDIAQSAAGPEQSTLGAAAELADSPALRVAAQSTPARVATEVGVGAALGAATEVIGDILKRAQNLRGAAPPSLHAQVDALANEARDLSLKPQRSPEDLARLRALGQQIDDLSAQILPPPPPIEQSAMATTEERARQASRRILEREKAAERAAASGVPDEFDVAARATGAPTPAVASEVQPAPSSVRAKKFKKLDDPSLEARYAAVLDRMQQKGQEAWEGITPWVRKEERSAGNVAGRGFGGYSRETGVVSGTAVTGKAGRAIGRMKDDARIAAELEAEFAARGINHDDVLERYLSRPSPQETADAAVERAAIQAEEEEGALTNFDPKRFERGAAHPKLAALLARAGIGAAGGGAVGSQIGETPAERRRNAFLGALVGGTGVAVAPVVLPRSRAGIATAAPSVSREAVERFGKTATRATGPINPDEFVNVAKFALDPAGEKRLRAEVADVVATTGLAPKQRVSWTETKRMAATLGLRPSDLVQREASRLNGAEMLAIRNIVSTNIDAVEGMSKRLADATIPPELRERLERAITGLEGQNSALLEKFVQGRSAAGRDLNNLKILANRTLDPATWLVKAQRLTGDAGFTPEVRTNVLRLINAGDRAGLVRYLAGVRKSLWYEKLTTLWKAGLLTNPKTHAANITSNTTMAVLETAKDNPAVLYDRLMSLWTGEITKAPTSLATVSASLKGARQGAREALQVLRGAGADDALRRFDIPHEVNFDNAILDTYTKTVFRLLGAEDRIFRGAALQRSLSEQARVLASREGLKGAKRSARIAELLSAPTDEMATTALRDAEIATFTDPTQLSEAISGFFGRIKSPAFKVGAEVVLPFKRTPAAVATRVFEYSPFGFIGGSADAWRVFRLAAKGKPVTQLQKRAAERLGRATTGAGAIAIGMWLYEKGLATGAAPTFSSREREQWRTEGKQPNSVLIDGKWRNVGRLSPLGNLIALGANLRAAVMAKEDETVAGRLAELGASTVRTVADQPFVTGIRGATEAVLDPKEQAARFGTNLAGSLVPAGVAAITRTVDPTIRKPEGVAETIQSRLPGASRSLPAQRTVFGEEVRREPGLIANILDPTSPSRDVREADPLVRELSRVGAAIGRLRRERDETPEAFEQRQITYGQRLRTRLERLVRSPGYQRAEQGKQAELIEDAVTELRRRMSRMRHRREQRARVPA